MLQRVLSRVTRGYRGIPIVTGGRTGLQEVKSVYNGLQGVCKRLVSRYIVPKYAHFSNMPPRCWAV